MVDLFSGYKYPGAKTLAFDEMFQGEGRIRGSYKELHRVLNQMTTEELNGRAESLADSYLAQGVTFDFAGEERPFPLDACHE